MNIIEKLRQKPQAEKIRIIWTVIIISVILLIILWTLTSKIGKSGPKDTTLFQTFFRGVKDVGNNYKK